MKHIDLFYQAEGLDEIKHIEIDIDATVAVLKALLVGKHSFSPRTLIFIEDAEDPLGDDVQLRKHATGKGLKVHLHRARRVKIIVTFNGKPAEALFAPGTTISRVKRWAAEDEFGMSEADAGEHVLQVTGTHHRPAPGTHIGALVKDEDRLLSLDLVPDERVQGMLWWVE